MLMGVLVQCTMLTYEKNTHMGFEHWPFVHGTIKTLGYLYLSGFRPAMGFPTIAKMISYGRKGGITGGLWNFDKFEICLTSSSKR